MISYADLVKDIASLIQASSTLEAFPVSITYAPGTKHPFIVKRHCNRTLCTTPENAAKYFILLAGRDNAEKAAQAAWKARDEKASEEEAERKAEAEAERKADEVLSQLEGPSVEDALADHLAEEAEYESEREAEAAMDAYSLGVRDEPLTAEEEADVRQCEVDYATRPSVPAVPAVLGTAFEHPWYIKQPYYRRISRPLVR
jgi:hypothetical protein